MASQNRLEALATKHNPAPGIPTATPVYFGRQDGLFGWLHLPTANEQRTPVVICAPIGFEYVRTHRTIRVLAGCLATEGYVSLRFDYHGIGDSIGSDKDENRVDAWLCSIQEAVAFVQHQTGQKDVTLIGLRLGGTLASAIAEIVPVSRLVLWNACASGRNYVREMQIVAAADKRPLGQPKKQRPTKTGHDEPDGIDAAGFLLTASTADELGALQLETIGLKGSPPVLLIERDDFPPNNRVAKSIEAGGSEVTLLRASGYREMMLAPQFSIVPHQTIDSICQWLGANDYPTVKERADWPEKTSQMNFDAALKGEPCSVTERAIQFGSGDRLFGILSHPSNLDCLRQAAVIMICGGSVHRIGANRMYVPIARRLAADGMTVLRMDLSGIGDSRPMPDGPSNRPYTANLCSDIEAAMEAVSESSGASHFILLGLCSGAYAAMQIAKTSDRVKELILINQLVYYLEADDLATINSDVDQSGHGFDYPRSDRLLDRILRKTLRCAGRSTVWLGHLFSRRLIGGDLSGDLANLSARGIRLTFIHTENDPAQEALEFTAGQMVRRLINNGDASMQVFADTDHIFSQAAPQERLVGWLSGHLRDITSRLTT